MKAVQLIWIGLLLSSGVLAQVSTSNGNFYVSYGDLTLKGTEWSVERNYNSFGTEDVFFGPGWGCNIATQLWPLPDGQLLVIFYGNGQRERYLPMQLNRPGVYRMIDTIIEHEIRRNRLERSPTNIIRRRAELVADGSIRASKYVDAIRNHSSKSAPCVPADSDTWINEYRESEKIVWGSDRYHLTRYQNDIYFNVAGRMIQNKTLEDDVSFQYDLQGKLSAINRGADTVRVLMDDKGHVLSFATIDSTGMVREASYEYNAAGLLVRSMDAGDNQYEYAYDRNNNMTFTRYSNGQYRRIEYDPATNRAIGFRERNGDSSRYEYGYKYLADGRLNLDHYYTRTTKYDSLGNRVFGTYWETEFRLKEDGDTYRHLMYEKTDTSESLYLYPTNVGNIIYGKVNAREAWQQYDAKTRPTYLRVSDSVYTTRYNVSGLPECFQAIDSVRQDTITYRYSYDQKGKLIAASRNGKKYLIRGSVEAGSIDLTWGSSTWTIGFVKKKADYFKDPVKGKIQIKSLTDPGNEASNTLFQDLLKLAIPQKIEHEWVWYRLNG